MSEAKKAETITLKADIKEVEPKKEPESKGKTEPADPLLKDIYNDLKADLGKAYNPTLESMDIRQAIIIMRTARDMMRQAPKAQEVIDKTVQAENPSNPAPIEPKKPVGVYVPANRDTYERTLKNTGGYSDVGLELEAKIKNRKR